MERTGRKEGRKEREEIKEGKYRENNAGKGEGKKGKGDYCLLYVVFLLRVIPHQSTRGAVNLSGLYGLHCHLDR